MKYSRSGKSALWQAIAAAALAFTADQASALRVLGPSDFHSHSQGLSLVQTGQEAAVSATAGQVAQQADTDPCHLQLGKLLDDKLIEESPSDVLLTFI